MQTLDRTTQGDRWQWRDYSVYYVRSATAAAVAQQRPPLLLVHGFGASTDHWQKNIAGLQDHFEVWAIDLLGFGRSQKPDIEYGAALWREQLRDFIAEVIGRPAILAGNSIGGYMSLFTAAAFPEWVQGLVLLNSAGAFTPEGEPPQPNLFQQALGQTVGWVMRQPITHLLIFLNLRRRSAIRKTLEKVYLDKSAITDELVENIYRPAWDTGAFEVFSGLFKRPPQGPKVDELLQQLHCPLLLLWGEGDPWMKARSRSELFRRAYPTLTEHFLQAGHCPHDEVPDQVNGLLRDWILEQFA